jgi:hypothetical protein
MSPTAGTTPTLASTAWTWALSPERNATNVAPSRTSSRSSRVASGAIHASGSRPSRAMSARSSASRSSLLTRRCPQFRPWGFANRTQ